MKGNAYEAINMSFLNLKKKTYTLLNFNEKYE